MYELIQKYGKGKGEPVMWKSINILDKALKEYMPEDKYKALERCIYYQMEGGHYNREFADEQLKKMYYTDQKNEKHYAPYWTSEQVRGIYLTKVSLIPKYNEYDFEVALNMIKSDYCPLLRRWYPEATNEEILNKLIDLTINWLQDDDNPFGDEKVWRYFNS